MELKDQIKLFTVAVSDKKPKTNREIVDYLFNFFIFSYKLNHYSVFNAYFVNEQRIKILKIVNIEELDEDKTQKDKVLQNNLLLNLLKVKLRENFEKENEFIEKESVEYLENAFKYINKIFNKYLGYKLADWFTMYANSIFKFTIRNGEIYLKHMDSSDYLEFKVRNLNEYYLDTKQYKVTEELVSDLEKSLFEKYFKGLKEYIKNEKI